MTLLPGGPLLDFASLFYSVGPSLDRRNRNIIIYSGASCNSSSGRGKSDLGCELPGSIVCFSRLLSRSFTMIVVRCVAVASRMLGAQGARSEKELAGEFKYLLLADRGNQSKRQILEPDAENHQAPC